MKKVDLKPYEDAVSAMRQELSSYVNDKIALIEYPQPSVSEVKSKNSFVYPCCIGVGALLLIVGAVTKTHIVSIGGAAIAVVGVYGVVRKKDNTSKNDKKVEVNYSELTNSIYRSLETVHKDVTCRWDDLLAKQKDKLKREVMSSDLSSDQKDKIMDNVVSKSIIKISMMDVLMDLSQIEKTRDVNQYRQYCTNFIDKYNKAIADAYNEQIKYYDRIKLHLE